MTASARRVEQRHREMFFAVIGRYLDRLHHYVRHLLAYLESTGTIVSGELTAEEVVDAVLLRAQEEFAQSPPTGRLRSWLIKLAQEQLGAEVARLNAWRATTPVRTQQDVPETPPTERVSTLGEEILYFHEPDEDLKIEDVLPDLRVPTPEQVAEATDLAWCTEAALAGMPDRWRRTLLHHYVDGLTGDALARALGEPRANVHRTLLRAREYLRQRMIDAGCAFRPPGERTRRRRPGRPRAAARGGEGGRRAMDDLKGVRVAILVTDGFEQVELVRPQKALDVAGADTHIVSPRPERVRGWNFTEWGDDFPVDVPLSRARPADFDALLLPGGVMNPDALRIQPKAVEFVKAFFDAGKPVAVICHGPWTVIEAGVARGRRIAAWPSLKTDLRNAGAEWVDEEVVIDDKLVSSRKPDDIPAFIREMTAVFAKTRRQARPAA